MKNYTTKTAALKATTIDTRLLDAKRIDTEKIFINGEELNNVSTEVVNYLWSDLQKTTVDDYVVLKCETEEGAYPIHLYINGILVMCQNNKT